MDRVAVAPAGAFARDVAAVGELGDDVVGGAFGDPDAVALRPPRSRALRGWLSSGWMLPTSRGGAAARGSRSSTAVASAWSSPAGASIPAGCPSSCSRVVVTTVGGGRPAGSASVGLDAEGRGLLRFARSSSATSRPAEGARPAAVSGDREGLRHAAGPSQAWAREGDQDPAQLPDLAQHDIRGAQRAPPRHPPAVTWINERDRDRPFAVGSFTCKCP